jgi:16S rRNA (uracil1498-N3)-methyltransferase
LDQDFLSNIELYFSSTPISNNTIKIAGDEFKHLTKVMRHTAGDIIYAADGKGIIYKSEIREIDKDYLTCTVTEIKTYANNYRNIVFCLPVLKSSDRLETALEKCVELGVTNFIVYKAERTIAKGNKLDRWNKVALSAMKQSLRSFLPNIEYAASVKDINNFEGVKIIFDQNFVKDINSFTNKLINNSESIKQYFIFGPEGGLTENEIQLIKNPVKLKLTANRLRSETAVIYTAALLNSCIGG